ncbi:MAG: type IV pilus assembly protein PilE [Psychromonas sp.]|jgi:type IV pilus assembly protein PilE|uniref:type IV pilin protein n=1 Tax=Psychromonas sp. TaxID=1884585 RepID=UPI0039E40E91
MNGQKGFTLIELMIVVAIVAILAAISFPSYRDSVRNARRAEAQATLQGLSQAMERYYTTNGTYAGAAAAGADTGAPDIFSTKSPIDGGDAFYNLKIVSAGGSAYVVAAEPINVQAGDGILILKSTGARGWDIDNDAGGVVSGLGTPNEVENTEWTW